MWRRNYYNEDWERRKLHLLRTHFEDVPRLSPLEESDEDRHSEDFPSPNSRPFRHRRESPLPELIIERVPKRNRHDEPEEFYEKLQITVQKYVDRLKRQNSSDTKATDISEISVVTNDDNIRSSLLENSCERNTDIAHGSLSDFDSENHEMNGDNAQDSPSDVIGTSEEQDDYDGHSDDDSVSVEHINMQEKKHCENNGTVHERILSDATDDSEIYESLRGAELGTSEEQKDSNDDDDDSNDEDENNESRDERIQSDTGGRHEINSVSTTKLHLDETKNSFNGAEILNFDRSNYFRLYYPDTTEDSNVANKSRTKDQQGSSKEPKKKSMAGKTSEPRTSSNNDSIESCYEMVSHQIEVDVHAEQSMDENIATNPHTYNEVEPLISSREEIGPIITTEQREITLTNINVDSPVEEVHQYISRQPGSSFNDTDSSSQQDGPEIMRAHDENTSFTSIVFDVENAKKRREKTPNVIDSDQCSYLENDADKAFIQETESMTFTSETQPVRFPTSQQCESMSSTRNRTSISLGVSPVSQPSPPKRRRIEQNVGVQTDNLDHIDVDWEQLKSMFFIGTPTIYKLCRCSNHTCS